MIGVLRNTWPLLLGVLLLMLGNGMQGSLLGIRGTHEEFSTIQLSIVTSGYFLGFLVGSQIAPRLIQNVGHVRVFAALGSIISSVLVLYPMLVDWQAWTVMRVLIGFGFAGIYITAESWLNNTATNETRGMTLSAYMIVQMLGIVAAQGLLVAGNPLNYDLFLIASVLVSFAFLPILLTASPAPSFETGERLGFIDLYRISPLGCFCIIISGGVFSAMFGMAAIWGSLRGLTVAEIAIFTSALYLGGLLLQFPIGRLSDRMDRRRVMLVLAIIASVSMVFAAIVPLPFPLLIVVAMILGGITYPMYSLIIAYTNDFLSKEQMAAASAGLIFLNGMGAIFGPIITGWVMGLVGPGGFFLFIGVLYAVQALYTVFRMGKRVAPAATGSVVSVNPTATPLAAVAATMSAAEIGPSPANPVAAAEAADALVIRPEAAPEAAAASDASDPPPAADEAQAAAAQDAAEDHKNQQ